MSVMITGGFDVYRTKYAPGCLLCFALCVFYVNFGLMWSICHYSPDVLGTGSGISANKVIWYNEIDKNILTNKKQTNQHKKQNKQKQT